MNQIIVYTDGYGEVINDNNSKPDPSYRSINAYMTAGWRVMTVVGAGGANSRGNFCFVLVK